MKCNYCDSDEAKELKTDRGMKQICLECLCIEQANRRMRKPYEDFDKWSYDDLDSWLGVLSRTRSDRPPIPEDNNPEWRSSPIVRESVVEFIESAGWE